MVPTPVSYCASLVPSTVQNSAPGQQRFVFMFPAGYVNGFDGSFLFTTIGVGVLDCIG